MANLQGLLKSIQNIMWQDTGLNGDAQRIEQLGWMLFFKIFSDKDQELELLDDNYKSPIPTELHWENWAGDDEGITGDELIEFVDRKLFPTLRNISIVDNKRALILREVFEGNNNYMKSGINIRKVLNKLNELDFNIAKDRHAFGELYETILKDLQSAGKSGEFYTPRAITQFITDMVNPQIGEKVLDPASGTGGFLTRAIEHLKLQAKNTEESQSIQQNVIGWEYKPLPFLLATTNLILHDVEVPNITFRDALDQPLSNYTERERVNVILANPPFGGIVANNNETNFPQTFRTKESADLFLIMMIHLLKTGGRAGIVLPDGSLTGESVKQRVRERLLSECNLHTIIRLPASVFMPYATIPTNLLFFDKGVQTREIWYYEHRLPEGQKAYSKTRPIRPEEFQPIKDWWNNRTESEIAWKVRIETIKARNYDLDIKNPQQTEVVFDYTSSEYIKILENNFLENSNLINKFKLEISEGNSGLINLFEKLGLGKDGLEGFSIEVINSKNFISELRRAILSEAIQGKLVPQDLADEPAQILLERLKAEKEKLVTEKKVKRDKPLSPIKTEEIPVESPNTWSWCRLGDICFQITDGEHQTPPRVLQGRMLLSAKNIKDGFIDFENTNYISEEDFQKAVKRCKPEKSDILLCCVGTIGRSSILNEDKEFAIVRSVALIKPLYKATSQFLKYVLDSPILQKDILKRSWGTAQHSLYLNQIKELTIPLPPLAEQERIVAKLEKLMKFCDELEANIKQGITNADQLLQTALKEALEPKEGHKLAA